MTALKGSDRANVLPFPAADHQRHRLDTAFLRGAKPTDFKQPQAELPLGMITIGEAAKALVDRLKQRTGLGNVVAFPVSSKMGGELARGIHARSK
jgi:hypothetical protein